MRKRRHNLTTFEEAALRAAIELRLSLSTRELMARYDVSRAVIHRLTCECKLRVVPRGTSPLESRSSSTIELKGV